MPYDATPTLRALKSFLQSQPRINTAQIGEPKSPPSGKINAGVYMDAIRTPEAVLDATTKVVDVLVRLYLSFTRLGEETELTMLQAVTELMGDVEGDFDLDGTIRAVDVAGIYGQGLAAEWGDSEVGGVTYRIVDISIPMIVDSAAASLAAA